MYPRYLGASVADALEDTPVILITGVRQTGKTTLCRQLINNGAFEGQLITLDDPTILAAAQSDPLGFLNSFGNNLIVDEVQRVPEIFLSIKKIVDENRKGRRFILTGSSQVLLQPKVADSLAGRIEMHQLWPLSQTEIRNEPSLFLPTLLSPGALFHNHSVKNEELTQMITTGGYPESVPRTTNARRENWFEAYITSLMQKDIRELSNIEGLSQMPDILHLLATRVGSTVNFSDIARLTGIKNTSFQRYMSLLEHVFLIVKIPAWTPNAEGRYVKSPKVFLNDTGVLCHLHGENAESLMRNRTLLGTFVENFAVLEILKQLSWKKHFLNPFHFSTHKGAEVDLILEDRKKQMYGIEIKSAASVSSTDFSGLKHLAAICGKKFKQGVVLYTGNKVVPFGENLKAVPLSALWKENG